VNGERRRVAPLLLVTSLVLARGALAHDWWLEPKSFAPKAGAAVEVHGRVGVAFRGDLVARDPRRIVRFAAFEATDEREIDGAPGADPLGTFTPRRGGLAILAYESTPANLYLRAPEFEEYLKEEGLESIVSLRAERGQAVKMGLERYVRCAKALLVVAPGAAAAGALPAAAAAPEEGDRAVGLPLELVAETKPAALASQAFDDGGTFAAQLLWRGRPLEGALVCALERDHPDAVLKLRSDARGRVAFALPRRGVWLVKAVHMVEAPKESRLDWESFWASLTFAVGARER